MIYLIANDDNGWTWNALLDYWARHLAPRVQVLHPHQLATARALPVGTYIFADQEQQTAIQREILTLVWDALEADGRSRILNHPGKVLGRYDLLKELYQQGINDFRVFRLHEVPADLRFPVFLRYENDHQGNRSPLLNDWRDLDEWLVRGILGSGDSRNLVVAEFCDTSSADGLFRKYGAYFFPGKVIAPRMDIRATWMVKLSDQVVPKDALDEWALIQTNPYRAQLEEVVLTSGFDFGRIDFAVADGSIRVWEVNSNPVLCHVPEDYPPLYLPAIRLIIEQITECILELDHVPITGTVPISLSSSKVYCRPLEGAIA